MFESVKSDVKVSRFGRKDEHFFDFPLGNKKFPNIAFDTPERSVKSDVCESLKCYIRI